MTKALKVKYKQMQTKKQETTMRLHESSSIYLLVSNYLILNMPARVYELLPILSWW